MRSTDYAVEAVESGVWSVECGEWSVECVDASASAFPFQPSALHPPRSTLRAPHSTLDLNSGKDVVGLTFLVLLAFSAWLRHIGDDLIERLFNGV